ncbi:MAG: DUF1015 domain-containing protein [Provencibacterium sp.]|jgi:hypothetical protein|nr:DUF1015 domain-containing protein [Provencibacterium sp.]
MKIISPADLLIPKPSYRERFSVVACDQFTSQPDYWQKVAGIVQDAPSALHLIVPESALNAGDLEGRIQKVHQTMARYLEDGVFGCIPNSYLYIERTLRDGRVRRGIIGKLDLKAYDYAKRSASPVRATEATVLERIPPRVAIRKGGVLESPHVMVLFDDPAHSVLSPLTENRERMDKLYDFPLMMDSGSIAGWRLDPQAAGQLEAALEALADPSRFHDRYGIEAPPLLFAVGDGNHSLASAKECYNRLCAQYGEQAMENHPARYALVELVNLHEPSLDFEPIHRIVFGIDRVHFLGKMRDYLQTEGEKAAAENAQAFTLVRDGSRETIRIGAPSSSMAVGSLQNFLDDYAREFGGHCDYIHGDEVVEQLSREQGHLGFLLPPIDKNEFFKTVLIDGALTRKTFSMGHAWDKRFYLECRKIEEDV